MQHDVTSVTKRKIHKNDRQPIECDGIEHMQLFTMNSLIILEVTFLHSNF